jgi:capsular polysaccharide biosynthesis protein
MSISQLNLRKTIGQLRRSVGEWVFSHLPLTSEIIGPPRGYYSRLEDWAKDNLGQGNDRIEIYPASQFFRTPPKTLIPDPPPGFDPTPPEKVPAQYVAFFNQGRVYGQQAAIIPSTDKVILDISMLFAPYYHELFYKPKLPKADYIDGSVLVLAVAPGENYYHWLLQCLPRLFLAEQAGVNLDTISAFVVNQGGSFISETLDLLGIPAQKRYLLHRNTHLKARQLIVPSIPPGGNPPKWTLDYLRQQFLKNSSENKEMLRVYISRRKAKTRRFTNEDTVEAALSEHHFQRVYLEDLTFVDQVNLMQQSSVLVAMHGAGLANITFCQPRTKIVEIFSPRVPEICFWTQASQLDLDYYFTFGVGERLSHIQDSADNYKDFECDIPLLLETLRLAKII